VELPDLQIDRIIRSIQATQGTLSNALRKEIALLAQPGLWEDIVEAVRLAFDADRAGERDPSQIHSPIDPV
jgi:hypothetical protein